MKSKNIYLLLIPFAILVAACSSSGQSSPTASPQGAEVSAVEQTPEPTTEVMQVEEGLLSVEKLMNATYSGIYDEPITLTDGLYEVEPIEGDPARPTVQYGDGSEFYGDLDGDGVDDAVVFLIDRGGGSAVFTYVAAQLNRDGQPVDAGAVMVEDRTQIRMVTIKDGQISVEFTTRRPSDPDCCLGYITRSTYGLQEGRLVENAEEEQELVKVSPDELDGTSWTLLAFNYEDNDQPVLVDTEVTLDIDKSQIAGFGGCNSYNSSFNLSEDNPFVMTTDPIAATKKACPDPILNQETAYFKALESVSQWGYVFGQLALYYTDAQGQIARLLFAPQATVEP